MRLSEQDNNELVTDFSKIKVGLKTLEDATIINFGPLSQLNSSLANKKAINEAIARGDLVKLREISDFFFRTSGIYQRLCRHFASLYRYDWMITPYKHSDKVTNENIIDQWNKILFQFDNLQIKELLNDIALQVIKYGCYYGYVIQSKDSIQIQELNPNYCRSRFNIKGKPTVEFNMKYFDDYYKDPVYRARIVNAFPKDFQKGYQLHKESKLPPMFSGDQKGWYLLEPDCVVKFNLDKADYPFFISTIPHILDLDEAQELDRKKMAQQLLKIIIQKMPTDKNGDLIFDVDEAKELHNNAVRMLKKAIGIDVLTTFAEVDVADMSDRNASASVDELEKVERTAYNESGSAQNLFNPEGNIALEKSILNDEAALYMLVLQFQSFLNTLLKPFNGNSKKLYFRAVILPTTVYNYKEMAKLYKEQMSLGFSKVMAQVALGHSQSFILANAKFENDVLDLVNLFVPPMSSNTTNAEILKNKGGSGDKKAGRTEKPDDEKSEKTIQNRESQN